jgi:DNA mismatch repair protein MutS
LYVSGERCAIAWVDLSTGRLLASELPITRLQDHISRIQPAELLCSSAVLKDPPPALAELKQELGRRLSEREPWHYERESNHRALLKQFKVSSLEGFGIDDDSLVILAAGALIQYVEETQKAACVHLLRIEVVDDEKHLFLDRATRSCLELFKTQRDGRREGTLLDTLDATLTPMGGRLLHEWLLEPLREVAPILERQRAVAELVDSPFLREDLRSLAASVLDIERLVAKVSTGRASPRDLVGLRNSLAVVGPMRAKLQAVYSARLSELRTKLDPLDDVVELVQSTLVDDPPLATREGGLVRAGFNAELDELRSIAGDGKARMAAFQAGEIEKTGITSLRVGFNSVFGYFLEVPRSQAGKIPAHYTRKQTIKTAERYITPELKEFETKVLHSEELARDLEYKLFEELRVAVARAIPRILDTARALAQIDVLAALAHRAAEYRYVAPVVQDDDVIEIEEGRHPVVERNLRADPFVPNDSRMNRSDRRITILTGPNMAGKSTYIRQAALIVLMAQIGSFVPARAARIGVVDRIFTRIGSADDIGRNASTFMVEMLEIANILNNASARSLIVLDEVGRGTSTFDGLALAWALVEHIHDAIGARTVFATHYHQLTELAERFSGVCNLNVAVREWNDEILFLHKIVDGGTDRSYGIHVARLAGVPQTVIDRARAILKTIESDAEDLAPRVIASTPRSAVAAGPRASQLGLFATEKSALEKAVLALDLDRLSPIDALLKLRELRASL